MGKYVNKIVPIDYF